MNPSHTLALLIRKETVFGIRAIPAKKAPLIRKPPLIVSDSELRGAFFVEHSASAENFEDFRVPNA